jgi:type IV secretory pathway component VirB8
LAAV